MNFRIIIKSATQNINITVQDAVIEIHQRATEDILKVKCIVRPDSFLQVRSNIVAKSGVELTNATILESNPVRDPNHWLVRPEQKYYKRPPDSQAVIDRRRHTRGTRKKQ